MTLTPLVDRRGPGGICTRCPQQPMLALVPVLRIRIDLVARELVDDEERRERREEVQPLAERLDVMEHASRDDCIPFPLELLELLLHEPLAVGRVGIDAE